VAARGAPPRAAGQAGAGPRDPRRYSQDDTGPVEGALRSQPARGRRKSLRAEQPVGQGDADQVRPRLRLRRKGPSPAAWRAKHPSSRRGASRLSTRPSRGR
jgi:hypothetical protein